jgi:NAD(P)-dependent dehydrogenase (short-subunit alcohol dehydrogenase family)
MSRLQDKVILVTGAAGSVGAAAVEAIRAAGGLAISSDLAGRHGSDHVLDVTAESDWERVIVEIGRIHDRLDGLVNAAGIAVLGTIEETDYATWKQILAVNLDGTFLGCKYALPLLKQRGGAIVNVSSISGLVGGYNFAAYNASKGGVRLLTKSIALHGARLPQKVRCNSVHPAFLEGPMVETILAQTEFPDGARARMTREIPLGRFGSAPEVAAMIVYLLSDEACFVTGAELVIDGGLTAR